MNLNARGVFRRVIRRAGVENLRKIDHKVFMIVVARGTIHENLKSTAHLKLKQGEQCFVQAFNIYFRDIFLQPIVYEHSIRSMYMPT